MAKIKKNVLSINLFSGWIRAYRLDVFGREKSWSAEEKVNTEEEIGAALKKAVAATKSRGCYATIVLDHDLLRHQTLDLPPMNTKDLKIYLKRKVEQFKEFKGEAAYSYTKTLSKGRIFVSINYLPMSFVKELQCACLGAGLFLAQVMPFSRVRAQQFLSLKLQEDELAALVVKMFDKVTLIIGQKDGSIFSDRGLKANLEDEEDIERVVKEVNRSILYSKQQFGKRVALIEVSERFQENFLEKIKKSMDIPVGWMSKSGRFYWVRELLNIPFKDMGNLVYWKARGEMSIRKHTRMAVAMSVALWIGAILSFAGVEYLLHNEKKLVAPLQPQILALQGDKEEWEKRKTEFDRLKTTVKAVEEERLAPVPGLFMGYLCDTLPEGLILTKSQVRYNEGKWEVIMDGVSYKGLKSTAEELKNLGSSLQKGPFRVRISEGWFANWLNQLKEGKFSDFGVTKFSLSGVIAGI